MKTEDEIRARLASDAHYDWVEGGFMRGFLIGFERSILWWVLDDSAPSPEKLSYARTREEADDDA